MPFYFKKSGSYKRMSVGSLEVLSSKLELDQIHEHNGVHLIDALNKGKDVYGYLNPKASELDGRRELSWAYTAEDADYGFYQTAEEI